MNCDPDAAPAQPLPRWAQSRAVRRARETGRLGDVVQQIVTPLLRDGHPNVPSVAKMLGLSARTLQRRLSEEGVTYARVVARARFAVAQRLLDDPACKVIEVALDLGYSDQAHFARAFARWTGLAPREFQRRRSTGRPAPARPANPHDLEYFGGNAPAWPPAVEARVRDESPRADRPNTETDRPMSQSARSKPWENSCPRS
jgi:AraC-like DNA-binding protein